MSLITVKESGKSIVARFSDSGDRDLKLADDSQIQQVGKDLIEAVDKVPEGKQLVIDFLGLTFVSSAIIGKLVLLNKRAKSRGLALSLSNISPKVLEVLKITRLHKTIRIADDDSDDDEPPEMIGSPVPRPKSPDILTGRAESPKPDECEKEDTP